MLKEIITNITPDNIRELQLLKDSLDIFLDYLVENSDISIDIKNILDESKEELYEEFIKVYLRNIYDVLSSAKHNENLFRKLTTLYSSLGLNIDDIDLSIDIVDILKKDFLLTGKNYEESKGTSKAMEYIYDIILKSNIQKDISNNDIGSSFRYFEGPNIFEYSVEGDLIPAVYEHFVKPLTHPVGWAYFYRRVFYLGFTDYFRINFDYTIREIKVKCMSGFTTEEDDYVSNISHFQARFAADPNYGTELTAERDNLIQENTSLDPNSDEYKSNERLINIYNKSLSGDFTLVSDSTIEFISNESIGLGSSAIDRKTIHFVNGERLEATETVGIILYDIDGSTLINYKQDFNDNCGLFTDYDETLTTLVTDEINFSTMTTLASTTGKLNVAGAGNVFVGSTISGDELVNKNVPVTYQSVVNKNDNTSVTNIHSPASSDTTICSSDKRFERAFRTPTWDSGLHFENFIFDGYTEEELELLSKSWIYKRSEPVEKCKDHYIYWDSGRYFESFNYDYNIPSLIEETLQANAIISQKTYGATARDEYSFQQIPNYEALVAYDFIDNFTGSTYWDSGVNFGTFDYDVNHISDDFEILRISSAPVPPTPPGPAPMILTVKTDNIGPGNNDQYTFYLTPNTSITVKWDDGTQDTYSSSGLQTHTYASTGTYNIEIEGDGRIQLGDNSWSSQEKVLNVDWGDVKLSSTYKMFFSVKNNITLSGTPDFSQCTDMSYMFYNAQTFNQDISNFDTSNVTNMENMFAQAYAFNQDISNFDTSNVTNMSGMFNSAQAFNQDISSFNTSSVTDMSWMFYSAQAFNQSVSNFDTSNVTDMWAMFGGAQAFNQSVSNFDTSNVTDISWLFRGASAFNQPLDNFDTSSAVDMNTMFYYATSFNQDISHFNTSSVTNMDGMFEGATIFNQDISGWDVSSVTQCSNFRDSSALTCPNTPALPDSCIGCASAPMTVTVKTDNFGPDNNNQYSLYIDPVDPVTIKWGDGSQDTYSSSGSQTHTYASAGTYDIEIEGRGGLRLGSDGVGNTQGKVLKVYWGNFTFTSTYQMFFDTSNDIELSGTPDFSQCTDMSYMFAKTVLNQDISNFNTSNVTDMSNMFTTALGFNKDISNFDTSNVTNMKGMFRSTQVFNQDISSFNTSSVTDMSNMFKDSQAFNQDISGWDTSSVASCTDFRYNSVLACANTPALPSSCTGC